MPGLPPGTVKHRILLTYQPVIVTIFLVVAVARWYSRRGRSRRKARATVGEKREDAEAISRCEKYHIVLEDERSSRSIPCNSARVDAIAEESDEGTRLQDEEHAIKRTSKKTSCMSMLSNWTRYILTYQPAPLPIIHRALSENSTTLCVLALFMLQGFYLVFKVGLPPSSGDLIGDRAGLLFINNLPWLYLFAAKNQPLKLLFGFSHENMNLLHRRLGEWMCFLAVVHIGAMLMGWYEFHRPRGLGLIRYLLIPYILWGVGTWLAYQTLYLTALRSFRVWWYEAFLGLHVLLQAGALIMLWLHNPPSRQFILAALAIFVLDRSVWRLCIKRHVTQARLQVSDDGQTVLVSADWPMKSRDASFWRKIFGGNTEYGWKPSQHVFISIPEMGRKYRFQYHPFTIASAAPAPGQTCGWFNLIIRAKGGFSRDLLHYSEKTQSTRICVDGPYGSLRTLEMARDNDVCIIVAGGAGIAVAYPLLRSLLHHNATPDQNAIPHPREQQICLIWIVQDTSHISWLGEEKLDELRELGLHLVVPPPTRRHGRPDLRAILREQVEDLKEQNDIVSVIVSGPDGLNRTVRNECARMIRKGIKVEVAVEKFGW
jgi:NAD(P)H-flavin reductase